MLFFLNLLPSVRHVMFFWPVILALVKVPGTFGRVFDVRGHKWMLCVTVRQMLGRASGIMCAVKGYAQHDSRGISLLRNANAPKTGCPDFLAGECNL